MKRLALLILIGYTASAGVADAATYYVSKNGSNSYTCTQAQNVGSPKLTIAAGVACLRGGGDTLLIRAGTYDERITDASGIPSGTSWSSKVRIANYNGETVWLYPSTGDNAVNISAGSYIEFDGINTRHNTHGAVFAAKGPGHHFRYQNAQVVNTNATTGMSGTLYTYATGSEFINLKVSGQGGPLGIYIDGGDGILVDGVTFDNVSRECIHIFSDDRPPPTNAIIRNNICRNITVSYFFGKPDPRTWGILVTNTAHQIYNNLVYGIDLTAFCKANGCTPHPDNSGIFLSGAPGGSNIKVWNNTVASNTVPYTIRVQANHSNVEVRNNIGVGGKYLDQGSGTATSNNLFGVDPVFVNPSGWDFQLTATSPAVDAASSVSAVTTDLVRVARPQGSHPDIGAYEYQGQAAAPGTPAPPTGVRIVSN